jgi:hypothetical protein
MPAAMLDAGYWQVEGSMGWNEQCRIDDAVLVTALYFFTVEDEHGKSALVDQLKRGDTGVWLLRDYYFINCDGFTEHTVGQGLGGAIRVEGDESHRLIRHRLPEGKA